ncbi:MAG: DNA-processing protein DprA, partial [Lachnospiraceae bacterium]|nr:DNA-processing protein DprA [Lachnospiraceae bacterium]
VTADVISGNLLLISDVKPDAGFSSARAMNRNKYIYASSYGAFVVSSDYNKGGTWNGAVESIHNRLTKTLIWDNINYDGNQKLIEKGGVPFDITEESIYSVITKKEETYEQMDLFRVNSDFSSGENRGEACDVYDIIKGFIVEHLNNGMSVEDISKNLNVVEGQMTIWLKRLCKEKIIKFDKGLYIKA